jgi:hypothetical protein
MLIVMALNEQKKNYYEEPRVVISNVSEVYKGTFVKCVRFWAICDGRVICVSDYLERSKIDAYFPVEKLFSFVVVSSVEVKI